MVLADRSFEALSEARHAGIQTLAVEILSTVGEEVADLRDVEQLLAATDDDAYNALVRTRFAPDATALRTSLPRLSRVPPPPRRHRCAAGFAAAER